MTESPTPPASPFNKEWELFSQFYAQANHLSPGQMLTVKSVFYAGALCLNSMFHQSVTSKGPEATSELIRKLTEELNGFANAQITMLKLKTPTAPTHQNN